MNQGPILGGARDFTSASKECPHSITMVCFHSTRMLWFLHVDQSSIPNLFKGFGEVNDCLPLSSSSFLPGTLVGGVSHERLSQKTC